jgi:ABC-2 type transport system permease protein
MNIRYFGLELGRQLRNARALIFTFAVPIVLLLLFGSIYGHEYDKAAHLQWVVVTTIQEAAYGAMMSSLSQAFQIVNERSVGWNRQLRITPLSGTGYMVTKVAATLAVALVAIVVVFLVGIVFLHASLSPLGWILAALGLWIGIIPFALIAILIGQFAKPSFAQPLFMVVFLGLAILGGLWIPLDIFPAWVSNIAQAVPSFWLNKVGQMGASLSGNILDPALVLGAWTIVFAGLITWRYRRDSARA